MPRPIPATRKTPTCLDLFCGIGGLALGLHRSGFRAIGGIDNWTDAARTFEHNLGLPCLVTDLTKSGTADIEHFFGVRRQDIDVISGGPPCQGFSTVGRRDSLDPRNVLWSHYRDIVADIRPAYVVIENVEGMLVMQSGKVIDSIVSGFAEIGYHMKFRMLRAADFGVPQLRKRTILLGWLDGLEPPLFPAPSHLGRHVTVSEAIFDLPPLASGESATEYCFLPTTEYQRQRRSDSTSVFNHEAARHPESLVALLKHIPDGGNRKSIPDDLQPKSGFHNSYARLSSRKPAIAVTSNMRKPSSARATHPLQPRGLTVREGLRLQSFDDTFIVLGSRTSQYLQVGNAVPPLLAEAIGREVLRAYNANTPEVIEEARTAPLRPITVGVRSAATDDLQLSLITSESN